MSEYSITIHDPHKVHHSVGIGHNSIIYAFTTIMEGADIGADCLIGSCVFIGPRARIGDGCVLHQGVAIPGGAVLGKRVFLGVNAVLMDCRYPNLADRSQETHVPPVIEDDVVIGTGALILPGVVVHAGAFIAAGAVVTRDVKAGLTVAGNPAKPMLKPRRKVQSLPAILA